MEKYEAGKNSKRRKAFSEAVYHGHVKAPGMMPLQAPAQGYVYNATVQGEVELRKWKDQFTLLDDKREAGIILTEGERRLYQEAYDHLFEDGLCPLKYDAV